MPRNEHKNVQSPKSSGAGDAQAEGTIESRIASWQRTGENRSKPKRFHEESADVESCARTAQLFVEDEKDDTLAVTDAEIAGEIAQLIADCLKRPYQRLIFSGATGGARFMSLDLLAEWCRDSGRDPAIAVANDCGNHSLRLA
jgi:hypothetical protein